MAAEQKEIVLIGTIQQILPMKTGNGQYGPWTSQHFTISTQEQYPKTIAIEDFKDKLAIHSFRAGELVEVGVSLTSREHNGQFYTSVRGWRIKRLTTESAPPPPAPAPARTAPATTKNNYPYPYSQQAAFDFHSEETDDLPF